MKVEIDADFSDAIARFDSLPEAVGDRLRWAAFKGVELLRDEVKIQAPRSHKRHYFYSKGSRNADGSKKRYVFEPGDLRGSVFAFYDKSESVDGRRAVYQVGWRDREGSRGRYEGGSLKAVLMAIWCITAFSVKTANLLLVVRLYLSPCGFRRRRWKRRC
ncbi:hypothetical protein [Neisseria subflava]|uniref:hypothetical protein n=1 Tax=Neisseria subflava TaxID=28449 RepID=UPI002029DE27|nr:hypothetical protein [Neisseria subflava]MCL9777658.1 hypothetical protein [Neisseria subflava]